MNENRTAPLKRNNKNNMARPTNKQQLLAVATDNYDKLTAFIASMSNEELTHLLTSLPTKRKRRHIGDGTRTCVM